MITIMIMTAGDRIDDFDEDVNDAESDDEFGNYEVDNADGILWCG